MFGGSPGITPHMVNTSPAVEALKLRIEKKRVLAPQEKLKR
jgi:hypothetical protein